jgi:hypothetical protein
MARVGTVVVLTLLAGWLAMAPAVAQQSRVFLTSTLQEGDLGGLAGADALCNNLASTASLGGTWVAWLSTSTVDAVDRLTATGPFVRAAQTSTVLADDISDLTDGSLYQAVELDENGSTALQFVWTGTLGDGTRSEKHCGDWAGIANFGSTGTPYSGSEWTSSVPEESTSCSSNCRLYCFEQAPASGEDGDADGVPDDLDLCPGTAIPERVPSRHLLPGTYALTDGDGIFDTVTPKRDRGKPRVFTLEDTAGCSCEQIISRLRLSRFHQKYGCSFFAMAAWTRLVNH